MGVHVGLLFLGLLAYAPAWAGCTARLYNLDSGEITPLKCSHRHRTTGTVSGTLPGGEKLSGEYVTVVNSAVGWGSIYSGVYSVECTRFILLRPEAIHASTKITKRKISEEAIRSPA